MWIMRWVVMVIIILTVLSFALQNQDTEVTLRMLGWQSPSMPLYMALFIAFAIGMISFLLLAIFQQLQIVSDLARAQRARNRAQRQLQHLEDELQDTKALLEERTRERDEAFEKLQGMLVDHGTLLPPNDWDREEDDWESDPAEQQVSAEPESSDQASSAEEPARDDALDSSATSDSTSEDSDKAKPGDESGDVRQTG